MTDSLIGTGSPIGRPAGVGEGKGDVSDEDAAVLTEMRKRFEYACLMEEENDADYVKNVKISSSSNQWDDEVKKKRGSNRPALTFNLLNLVVKQIIGDYRQNKMSIKVLPSGGPATEESADILAGIIRNIEMDSNAGEAYTNALECAARGNRGEIRILPEYEADDVFTQKLVIKSIKNPLTVKRDPNAKLLTRADAEWTFITEMMSKEEFRRLYPKAEEFGWDIVDVHDDDQGAWGDDKTIRLCEYFTKKRIEARLVAFDNGACIQIDNDEEIYAIKQLGINPVKERKADRINIHWRKCNGSHILEERIYKTKYIPVIPVLGEEVNIEGKTYLRSAIYYGIDAQHSYNYERSTAIENSALSAKAPWKVTHKMIELWRDQWDKANTTPQPYLIYTHDPAVPAGPERIEPPTPSTAAMQNSQTAALDVQRTTGVFNSQVGEQTNVQSGVGLSEQQSQGQTSTYIFPDNLKAGIEQCGRVLVDWIPEFYDTDRVVRTINSEDDVEMQKINQKKENPLLGITEVLNDIRVGEYDVIVTAGKAFASRRREAVEGLINWAKAFPQQAPLVADQVLENMDVPGGEVMAERIKRSLPPQVVNDPDSPEGQQAAQQAQQKQQQAEQLQMQLVQGKLQVEQGKNQASMAKSSADVQKANAEVIKAKSDIEIAAIEAHNAKMETAAHILDVTRMNTGATPTASGLGSSPSQPPVAPQGAVSAGGSSVPPAAPRTNYGSRQEDIQKAHKKDEQDMKDASDIKQMLTGLAGHLVASHQQNQQMMQHLAQSTAEGHKAIAQGLAHTAAIAGAPVEAIRDKTGRITGSRKKMPEQAA
jgi:hypothetical protein